MSDKKQQLLDLFEKYKKDLDGGRLEALFKFTEECEKELKQSPKYGKITTAIMHSYIMSAYQVGRKRAEDYYKALRKDEEEHRFRLTCEETPPDGELVYCVGKDHCTQKELSGIYFYHNGYWWTDEQRKSDECWWDDTGINDYVFYKWMKLPKEINYMEITSDQETLAEFNVKVLHLDLCEASDDPNLVARADVEVTNDTSSLSINGLNLRYNDTTGEYSIVAPKSPSGVCINELTQRAVTSAVVARYEQVIGKFPKRDDIEKIENTLDENMETHDMNANKLQTEESKIQWLKNEIRELEYVLSFDCCINRNLKLNQLQMYRELLAIKMATCRANAVRKIKNNLSKDAAEFLKDFGTDLTDAEKMSIKSLICLRTKC